MIGRRNLILGMAGGGLAAGLAQAAPSKATSVADPALLQRLRALEDHSGGRLGVAVVDVAGGPGLRHRSGERFAMCSTFKVFAAAAVLNRVDEGREKLGRLIPYAKADVLEYSPVTESHAGAGMPLEGLCEAAVSWSDNTAANLILKQIGGPAGLTAYLRSLGDQTTRLDRWEPALNSAIPGDPRDTTSPDAAVETLRSLVLRRALSPASRTRLTAWLVGCKTGDARLRAGLPRGWRVGDKTGTSAERAGTSNDLAVVWRPDGRPAVIAAFLTRSKLDGDGRNAVLAEVGRIAGEALT